MALVYIFIPQCVYLAGFHTAFFVGGGENFLLEQDIDIKNSFLGGVGCPSELIASCPEIKSGGFWQLADCSQIPITCVQNYCHFLFF